MHFSLGRWLAEALLLRPLHRLFRWNSMRLWFLMALCAMARINLPIELELSLSLQRPLRM